MGLIQEAIGHCEKLEKIKHHVVSSNTSLCDAPELLNTGPLMKSINESEDNLLKPVENTVHLIKKGFFKKIENKYNTKKKIYIKIKQHLKLLLNQLKVVLT